MKHISPTVPTALRVGARRGAVLLGMCTLWACAGDSGADTTTRTAIQAVAPERNRDACEIITAADVTEVEGQPIEAVPQENGVDDTQCAYVAAAFSEPIMYLTIHWREGKTLWESWGMGRDMAARMMGDPVADSITARDPLADIGDGVRYNDIMPSFVLTGDILIEVIMPLMVDTRSKFPVLARKAVARIGAGA